LVTTGTQPYAIASRSDIPNVSSYESWQYTFALFKSETYSSRGTLVIDFIFGNPTASKVGIPLASLTFGEQYAVTIKSVFVGISSLQISTSTQFGITTTVEEGSSFLIIFS
jgi:hypothetical protein